MRRARIRAHPWWVGLIGGCVSAVPYTLGQLPESSLLRSVVMGVCFGLVFGGIGVALIKSSDLGVSRAPILKRSEPGTPTWTGTSDRALLAVALLAAIAVCASTVDVIVEGGWAWAILLAGASIAFVSTLRERRRRKLSR